MITGRNTRGDERAELLEKITRRHKGSFRKYPDAITAETGFRVWPGETTKVQKNVETVPGRGQIRAKIDMYCHHSRTGIEGIISVF